MKLMETIDAIQKVKSMDLEPEVLKDTLDSLEVTRDEKLDGIASWIEENKAKIAWIAEKEKQLRAVKKSLNNQNDSLMEYLTFGVDSTGLKEIRTANHILKPRNYRASTIIEDETKIPKDFIETEEVTKINKKAIFEKLQDGEQVPGAYLKANRKTRIL